MEAVKTPSRPKLDVFDEANELYQRCTIWAMKHNKGRYAKGLTKTESELHDVANVLLKYMAGKNPFSDLTVNHLLDLPDVWINRVGALLATNNKKQVSEFFCLKDDGRSLTQYIANRAHEFLSESELQGLSPSQKVNLLFEAIEQRPEFRDHFIEVFETHFPDWLAEKQAEDITYKSYTFEEWVDMARTNKG